MTNQSDNFSNIQTGTRRDEMDGSVGKRFAAFIGYLMLVSTVALIAIIPYKTLFLLEPDTVERLQEGENLIAWLLVNYSTECFALLGALILGVIGFRLIGRASKGTLTVIPPEDRELLEELIKGEKTQAISQYVVISSLSGLTGSFKKIDFTGLPLVTVILTLIFCGLSFLEKGESDFIELAKLTTGAFIGSFVQKGQDAAEMHRSIALEEYKKRGTYLPT